MCSLWQSQSYSSLGHVLWCVCVQYIRYPTFGHEYFLSWSVFNGLNHQPSIRCTGLGGPLSSASCPSGQNSGRQHQPRTVSCVSCACTSSGTLSTPLWNCGVRISFQMFHSKGSSAGQDGWSCVVSHPRTAPLPGQKWSFFFFFLTSLLPPFQFAITPEPRPSQHTALQSSYVLRHFWCMVESLFPETETRQPGHTQAWSGSWGCDSALATLKPGDIGQMCFHSQWDKGSVKCLTTWDKQSAKVYECIKLQDHSSDCCIRTVVNVSVSFPFLKANLLATIKQLPLLERPGGFSWN